MEGGLNHHWDAIAKHPCRDDQKKIYAFQSATTPQSFRRHAGIERCDIYLENILWIRQQTNSKYKKITK